MQKDLGDGDDGDAMDMVIEHIKVHAMITVDA